MRGLRRYSRVEQLVFLLLLGLLFMLTLDKFSEHACNKSTQFTESQLKVLLEAVRIKRPLESEDKAPVQSDKDLSHQLTQLDRTHRKQVGPDQYFDNESPLKRYVGKYPTIHSFREGCPVMKPLNDQFPNATCFAKCKATATNCVDPTDSQNLNTGQAHLVCTARIMLLGFHKCGTTDLSAWFSTHPEVYYRNGDYFTFNKTNNINEGHCPHEQLMFCREKYHFKAPSPSSAHAKLVYMLDCPGCLRTGKAALEADTLKMILVSNLLQYIYSPHQTYIISMRNPTDRFISEYFYTHKTRESPLRNMKLNEIGDSYLHTLVERTTSFLDGCFREIGYLGCAFGARHENTLNVNEQFVTHSIMGGLYGVYIEQFLQQMPNTQQIIYSMLEEYSQDQQGAVKRIFQFVGLSTQHIEAQAQAKQQKVNSGYRRKPVLSETIDLLDRFYKPFNEKLSQLLQDDKWLFERL